MTVKVSGRSALILATGLFVCFAGPSQVAAGAEDAAARAKSETAGAPVALHKYTRHGSRHWKRHAHRKFSKLAAKSSTEKSSTHKKADATDDGDRSRAIPPSVADAKAQLVSADTPTGNAPTGNAKDMTARANDILQNAPDKPADAPPAAETQVISTDQLNDVDRTLNEGTPPAPTLAMASTEAPAAPVAPVMASNSTESAAWDQTSLIGKIFIGFGALLTMASAARMLMA